MLVTFRIQAGSSPARRHALLSGRSLCASSVHALAPGVRFNFPQRSGIVASPCLFTCAMLTRCTYTPFPAGRKHFYRKSLIWFSNAPKRLRVPSAAAGTCCCFSALTQPKKQICGADQKLLEKSQQCFMELDSAR